MLLYHSNSFDSIFQVKVGPGSEVFSLHKALLCTAAPYLKAVFEGEFSESYQGTLDLCHEDVDMFKHFQLWLYTGKILSNIEDMITVVWLMLCRVWIFAEARGIPLL